MRRYFYGWNVLAATVVIAFFAFGLGFYGIAVYLASLQRLHGWSASAVSAPVTVYYVAGALLTAWMARAYDRFGPRAVVTGGTVAMALGVSALGAVSEPWHLYPVFLVMAVGWGSMSGAALNILVAPWFARRRGLAVSVAFTGATLGGVVIALRGPHRPRRRDQPVHVRVRPVARRGGARLERQLRARARPLRRASDPRRAGPPRR